MAEMSGISADSLRYYEKLGILSPKRAENGYRFYDERDFVYLQNISVLKYAHFSLADIKTIIKSLDVEDSPECRKKNLDIFTKKRVELVKMIENYQSIVKLIDKLFPIMNNIVNFHESEWEIIAFVQEVFNQIYEKPKNV